MDVGLVTEDDKTRIIDRSKLRRERERCRNEIRSEESVKDDETKSGAKSKKTLDW